MQPVLILDAEALHALAQHRARRALFERARAILTAAHEMRALVRVPAPILAELYRGARFDPAIDRVLTDKGIKTMDLTPEIARSAGHLLAQANLSSAYAVDAFVVATALTFPRAIIATGDPDDITRLAGGHTRLTVLAL